MNKHVLKVPKGVKFLSDWKNFRLFEFPYILNKQLTGCGFTQWALTSNQNVILCSPRRALLESKMDAYRDLLDEVAQGEEPEPNYSMYYAKNDSEKILDVGKDISKERKSTGYDDPTALTARDVAIDYKNSVISFYDECLGNPFDPSTKKFCKILVTYDSYRKVKEALEERGVFNQFHVIVDEWQAIFTDSRFKSNTEMEFIGKLRESDKICFVSATPMIDKYLELVDEFKSLPYLSLNWGALDPGRVTRPKIIATPCSKLNQKVREIVEKYRTGSWKDLDNNTVRRINKEGKIEEFSSREAVFYINSVKNICDIIRLCGLTQNECNIICAITEENKEAIRKAFKVRKADFKGLGRVPSKKEMANNKMFTFCTRTVYLGADFYSDNARSFIFSDANVESLAVDITLDLPQILGRQRLFENPWKNSINIYFKPLYKKNIKDFKIFSDILSRKEKETLDLLAAFEDTREDARPNLAKNYERSAIRDNYRDNYVAVDKHSGGSLVPKFNRLVMLSEIRSFEIQQIDYADRCSVRSSIDREMDLDGRKVSEVIKKIELCTNFIDKMKTICTEFSNLTGDEQRIVLSSIDDYLSNYVVVLGVDRIKSLSYRRDWLEVEINKLTNNQDINIKDTVYSEFKTGDKISKVDVKQRLKDLYQQFGLKKTAKATDLEEFFEVSNGIKVKDSQGKWVNGLEILKKKG